jgi:HAD superfamily hydrolase (TIGR01490 family)
MRPMPQLNVVERSAIAAPEATRVTAVFDLDRTITSRGNFTPFLLFCLRRRGGLARGMAAVIGHMAAYVLKLIDRKTLKERMLAATIAGASRSELVRLAEAFVDQVMAQDLRPGARRAIEQHQAAGHNLVMVTACFDFLAERIGRRLGFDAVISTRSIWDCHARLMAGIDGDNCYGPAKIAALQSVQPLMKGCHVVVYSDHHTDVPLFELANEAVAVNPSRKLRRLAVARRWRVEDWMR